MHLAVQKHASSCSKACIHETSERSHYVNRGSWPAEGSPLSIFSPQRGRTTSKMTFRLLDAWWCATPLGSMHLEISTFRGSRPAVTFVWPLRGLFILKTGQLKIKRVLFCIVLTYLYLWPSVLGTFAWKWKRKVHFLFAFRSLIRTFDLRS